jgi:putative phosphoribosyl transferase
MAAHWVGDIVEIPPEDWIGFFDSFSRQHEGWLASIEITLGKEKRTALRDRPLDGISCDHLSVRDEIYLSFEGGAGEHLTHPVRNPMKVVFRRDLEGAHEGIDINSADGSLTSVRFRSAAKPETLDGLVSETKLAPRSAKYLAGRRKPQPPSGSDPSPMAFHIPADGVLLEGELRIPANAKGVVLFAHGSGSSRHSPRNQYVARVLGKASFATLLMDLLTLEEERRDQRSAGLRFHIELLARRLTAATWWLKEQSATANLHIGYFGASTGAAAALVAAARLTGKVSAIVSRGGRPDLAGMALHKVIAPTLLIVGENDPEVLALNREAYYAIPSEKRLEIVPEATHLFEEPGTLERVAQLASNWFDTHLASPGQKPEAA